MQKVNQIGPALMDHQNIDRIFPACRECLAWLVIMQGRSGGEGWIWRDVSIMICLHLSQKLGAIIWQCSLNPGFLDSQSSY